MERKIAADCSGNEIMGLWSEIEETVEEAILDGRM